MSFSNLFKWRSLVADPVANTLRPMDPLSIKPLIEGSIDVNYEKTVLSSGISHVIHNYFKVNNILEDKGFLLAIDEIFRSIRDEYRTILPYTQDEFKRYVLATVYTYIGCKQIQSVLAGYNFVDPSIPELHDALTHVVGNNGEKGFVQERLIKLISDADLSVTLNNFAFLAEEMKALVMPSNVKGFIDWLFGSVFTDSSYPNRQMYVNYLFELPVFAIVDGKLDFDHTTSIFDLTIKEVEDSINVIKTFAALVNADLHKVGGFVECALPSVGLNVVDKDYDYFNILINSYDETGLTILNRITNDEYVRADILGEDSIDHRLATCFGLHAFAGITPFCELVAQSMYITADNSMYYEAHRTVSHATGGLNLYPVQALGNLFYTINGSSYLNNQETYRYAASTVVENLWTADTRWNADPQGTLSDIGFQAYGSGMRSTQEIEGLTGEIRYELVREAAYGYSPTALRIRAFFSINNGVVSSAKLQVESTLGTVTDLVNIGTADTASIYYKLILTDNGCYVRIYFHTGTSLSITSAQYAVVKNCFAYGASFSAFSFALYCKSTATSVTYKMIATSIVPLMVAIEQIDYHMPIPCKQQTYFEDGTVYINQAGSIGLIKETFLPVMLNKDTVREVMRFMILGLFNAHVTPTNRVRDDKRTKNQKYSKRPNKKDK